MSKCTCCGGDVADRDRPWISLDTNRMMSGGEIIQLSAREAELMSILISAMPLPVSTERILARLYGGISTESAYNTLRVFVHNLRRKIENSSVKVTTIRGRGHAVEYKNTESLSGRLGSSGRAA